MGGGGGGVREQVQHQVALLARPDQNPAHSSDWGKHPAPATLDLASILQLLPAAGECGKMECTKCPSLSPTSGSQLPGGSENQGDFLRNVLLINISMFVAAHNLRVNIEIWLSSFGPVTHFGDSLTGLSGLRPLALLIKTPFLSWLNFFPCSDFAMLGKTG